MERRDRVLANGENAIAPPAPRGRQLHDG